MLPVCKAPLRFMIASPAESNSMTQSVFRDLDSNAVLKGFSANSLEKKKKGFIRVTLSKILEINLLSGINVSVK